MNHSRLLSRVLASAILLTSASVALATQQITVGDGKNVTAKIAAKDLTLIRIKNGRITGVAGAEGKLTLQKDKKHGQIFVQPTRGNVNKAVSIFVIDERGETYRILLLPVDQPAESIDLVRIDAKGGSEVAEKWEKSQPYVASIKNLVRLMAIDEAPDGYSVTKKHEVVPLWQEANMVLSKSYHGENLKGEHYVLTNVDGKEMVLAEQEMFQPGVLAISIQDHKLKPGQSTNVYIVIDGAR